MSLTTVLIALLAAGLLAALVAVERLWRRLQHVGRSATRLKAETKDQQRQLVKQKEELATLTRQLAEARQSLLARTVAGTSSREERTDEFERTVILPGQSG